MKRIACLVLLFALVSCTAAQVQTWKDHPYQYASGAHAFFSFFGYQDVKAKDVEKSSAQGWWGDMYYPVNK